DIERIEVSRGPNLATYGSNSFQAAINIITRTAAEDQGVFIQNNVGNNDIADFIYRYGGSNGKLDYRVTASSYNDSGLESANEFDYPDGSQSDNIDYRLDYQIDNKNSLSYQGGFGRNQQQADKNHEGLIPTARTVDNTRFFQFIKWENSIDQENTLLVQYYYNLDDKKDKSESELISFGAPIDDFTLDINNSIKAERHNLELTHFVTPNDDLKLVWGLSAQADIVRAPLYLGTNKDVTNNQFRGFANIEWHVNQSNIINFGALAEKNNFTATELSPRLSFTHHFNNQHSIRFGISQAIRSPFIFEAKANQFYSKDITANNGGPPPAGFPTTLLEQPYLGGNTGDLNLENERIISREIAYYGNFFKSKLLINARLFHDDIDNFIDTFREDTDDFSPNDNVPDNLEDFADELLGNDPLNRVRVYENRIESTTTGLELELDYRIDPTLRLIASGAIINLSSNDPSIRLSAPQHSFSFLASKRFNDNYSGSLGYYFVEAFKWTDAPGNGDDVSTDDYETLDLRASRHFKFSQTSGSLSLVLKNLLDDYSDYQGDPRNATAPTVIHSTLAYIDFRLSF
ncbi:MAG: TonB-dependent receptor, partial [Gammaproteobacteria bacterium]|nr:TonB-dependent receptor [Gammaproteobacteria bacterium]